MSSFRARARTVDLLGRQQIAGIPTAVSELFKNAHDAYATRVEVDFYREQKLLILRDDGLGMTPEDFEQRWLTLGTDSKVGDSRGIKPPPTLAQQERPVLGEKGIGRLAIASIGSQVLVLTRPHKGRSRPLTVALINWRLFELPGIDLSDVSVPLIHRPDGSLPGGSELRRMVGTIRRSLKKLGANKKEREAIEGDLDSLKFDPSALLGDLGQPRLAGKGHGTHFIVVPTSEQLSADIDGPKDEDVAPPLVKTLVGFANTMTPNAQPPRIETAFRDHWSADDCTDIIGTQQFFTPDDWKDADHHIQGWFDETGFFTGTVDVYGKGADKYKLAFTEDRGAELDCGAFRLQLAYVQGQPQETRLDLGTFRNLSAKLDHIGGLYIYRDGIRVLPYGNPDFDFLGIELSRSRRAGTAFFSYRRMFGVIEIDGERNRELQEKAGREGFRDNRAYRQFRDVLRNFLKQVAATYFKADDDASAFILGKDEAKRRYAQRKAREREAIRERKRFEKRVEALLKALAEKVPEEDAEEVVETLRGTLSDLGADGRKATSDELLAAELDADARLQAARTAYQLAPPAGFGLTPDLRRDSDFLRTQLDQIEERVFAPAAHEIAQLIHKARKEAVATPDHRQRLVSFLEQAVESADRRTRDGARQARAAADSATRSVEDATQHSLHLVGEVSEEVLSAAQASKNAPRSDAALVEQRLDLERRLDLASDHEVRVLLGLAERLRLATDIGDNGDGPVSAAETTALLEEEVLELRERIDQDFELAQLGMATQVITHELDVAVVEVRENLRRLDAWADVNPKLQELQRELRAAFEHLDGYLSLFTPLQRRLRRRREKLGGAKIEEFLQRLFGQRLEQLGIELEVTDAFREWTETGFRSTIYPVFVNLIDNATYWVRQASPPYRIRLDATPDGLIIDDSGPSVPERDREVIWDYGFSRKPGGRGAGLHISREVLSRDGWGIDLVDRGKRGTAFVIRPPEENG